MTNIEKLTQVGIIGDIRQRFGADNENDSQMDDIINTKNNDQLMSAYAGWHLGTGEWWTGMKAYYDGLEKLH